MTDKRYQLRQEDLDYPIYSDLVDIEDNDRVICTFNNDSQINKMVVLLNEKEERIKELEKENEKIKQELESFEKINFTDLCDGSRTILYMKKEKYINKENVGDENE